MKNFYKKVFIAPDGKVRKSEIKSLSNFSNTTIYLLLFILTFYFQGCSMFCDSGSGNVIKEKRSIANFTEIDVGEEANLILRKDQNYSVEIEVDDNIMKSVKTEVKNNCLCISTDGCVQNLTKFNIYIAMPEITELQVDGSGEVKGESEFKTKTLKLETNGSGSIQLRVDVEELQVEISGSGSVHLNGKTNQLQTEINGSGSLYALQLESNEADLDIGGAGNCNVNVIKTLKADISGSGSVSYSGNPQNLDTDVKGSGSIKPVALKDSL